MNTPKINYKQLYESLHQRMMEEKAAHERNINKIEEQQKERKIAFEKDMEKQKINFEEALSAALPLFMHDAFSEGYLASDLKFELKVSRKIKPEEIEILIKKLQFDKEILSNSSKQD